MNKDENERSGVNGKGVLADTCWTKSQANPPGLPADVRRRTRRTRKEN